MGIRRFRVAAAILCIVQVSGLPVHAGPIVLSSVRQSLSPNSAPISLRLRNLNETSNAISDPLWVSPAENANHRHSVKTQNVEFPDTTNGLFTGIIPQQKTVEVIAQDDVEGTICDCGEILIAGGGFPKWPFLFLGVIPLFFLGGSEETPSALSLPTPTPPPAPTPPSPAQVPEPATLLLFGSSLAAVAGFLRRRKKLGALPEESAKPEAAAC